MGTNLFAFVIVLGILIFFHELGHFLVARLCGVGVNTFSLGFGPRIFGKTIGRTDYRISAIPLGGYVKMVGEDPGAEIDPADRDSAFTHKHVFQRMMIVAAGPLFNFLLAFLIFYGIFQFSGMFILQPTIGKVQPGKPADVAGLQSGDRILAIEGTAIESWDDMAVLITESNGRELTFSIRRDEQVLKISIQPELDVARNIFGEDIDRYVIGIAAAGKVTQKRLNPAQALFEGVHQTYKISELTLISVVKLIQGSISSKTLGGPIMIAQMAGEQAQAGMVNLLFFTALISINLGILNFLPIPVLDGGHLLFFAIEAVTGRPVSLRVREIAQQIGIFILISLMIYAFYNDITRILFN
jgi:regulator of sigma E protease